jgi:hypothetical protein
MAFESPWLPAECFLISMFWVNMEEAGSESTQLCQRGQKMEARSRVEEVQWKRLRGVIMQWLLYNSIQVTLQID